MKRQRYGEFAVYVRVNGLWAKAQQRMRMHCQRIEMLRASQALSTGQHWFDRRPDFLAELAAAEVGSAVAPELLDKALDYDIELKRQAAQRKAEHQQRHKALIFARSRERHRLARLQASCHPTARAPRDSKRQRNAYGEFIGDPVDYKAAFPTIQPWVVAQVCRKFRSDANRLEILANVVAQEGKIIAPVDQYNHAVNLWKRERAGRYDAVGHDVSVAACPLAELASEPIAPRAVEQEDIRPAIRIATVLLSMGDPVWDRFGQGLRQADVARLCELAPQRVQDKRMAMQNTIRKAMSMAME